jgi:ABC-type siderophore export system fused ATPase/permease subunit
MNELAYYASEEIIHEESTSVYCKSKMICALSSDTETISDAFPFSTNIFANNVMVILSSILVIIVEVPPSVILIVFLVIYANNLNRSSHRKDEYLQIAMKEKDVDVYRVLSEIENGKKYILIHHKLSSYT